MSKRYLDAPDEVIELMADIMSESYKDLKSANIRVGALMVETYAGGEISPTFNDGLNQHPAMTTKIAPKDKIRKKIEVEIILDSYCWEKANDTQKRAIIDRELYRIVPALNKEGDIKTDENGNTEVKLINYDMIYQGFSAMANKYGNDSVELMHVKTLKDSFGHVLGL